MSAFKRALSTLFALTTTTPAAASAARAAGHCCAEGSAEVDATDAHEASALNEGAASVYVCPMHTDVTSNAPGRCPKCNMQLERKPAGIVRERGRTEK